MLSWFLRRKTHHLPLFSAPGLEPQIDTSEVQTLSVSLMYCSCAASVQKALFVASTDVLAYMKTFEQEESIMELSAVFLSKYHAFLRQARKESAVLQHVFSKQRVDFSTRMFGKTWRETLLSLYIIGGFFDDFFRALLEVVEVHHASDLSHILDSFSGHEYILALLNEEMEREPEISSEFALWGRSLVGDMLLSAKHVIEHINTTTNISDPVDLSMNELAAQHTKRMDALGLTA